MFPAPPLGYRLINLKEALVMYFGFSLDPDPCYEFGLLFGTIDDTFVLLPEAIFSLNQQADYAIVMYLRKFVEEQEDKVAKSENELTDQKLELERIKQSFTIKRK